MTAKSTDKTAIVDLEAAERLAEQYERHSLGLQVVLNSVGGMPEGEAVQLIEWSLGTHSPPAALGSWAQKNGRRSLGNPNTRRGAKDEAHIWAAKTACKRAHQESEAVREAIAARDAERDGTPHEEYMAALDERAEEARKWLLDRLEQGRDQTLAAHREYRRNRGAEHRRKIVRERPRDALERDLGCSGGESGCAQTLNAYLEETERLAAYAESRMSKAGASYYEIYMARGFARYAREEQA